MKLFKLSLLVAILCATGYSQSVTVTPSSTTLQPGQTQQFNVTTPSAIWTVTGAGSVSSTGLYTAPANPTNDTVQVCIGSSCATATVSVAGVNLTIAPTSLSFPNVPVGTTATAQTVTVQNTGSVPESMTRVYSGAGFATAGTGTCSTGITTLAAGASCTYSVNFTASAAGSFTGSIAITSNSSTTTVPLSATAVTVTPPPNGSTDGPATLPTAVPPSSMASTPAPGKQTPVAAGSSLQTALNNASCGDTLLLQAGAVFSGKVSFPNKPCDDAHWIVVRTSTPDAQLPPEGTELQPCYSGVASLPGRPAFKNCPSGGPANLTSQIIYTATSGSGPVTLAAAANHYRLGPGLEITANPTTGTVYDLIAGGQNTNKIVVDRDWIHGTPQGEVQAGIVLHNMQNVAIVNNYFSDTHCISVTGACTDSHAIGGGLDGVQAGPFLIQGNFLESSGEDILFGGGSATFTPADITIKYNHFFKPMIWLKGQPGFVGATNGNPFMVKNHLELKNAQRVLVEGNVFEDVWGGFSQAGFSILLTPKSQAVSATQSVCPLCKVQDITIRLDKISHAGTGISIANVASDAGGCATAGQRYSIHDITMDDINMSKYAGNGEAFQVDSGCAANNGEILNSMKIDHVTAIPDLTNGKILSIGGGKGPAMFGFQFTNSVVTATRYPVWNVGGTAQCSASDIPLTTLNTCFPAGYTFTNNALVSSGWNGNYPPSKWPVGNFFPTSDTAIGFVNFNGGIGGDYHLTPGGPYSGKGTDGKDLGADINALNAAIANVN